MNNGTGKSHVETEENARLSTIIGGITISDIMKPTLGPYGNDKILMQQNGFKISNDGATILTSLTLDNPSASILVDLSKSQDKACGDGTTSVAVLTGEILRQADNLLEQGFGAHEVRVGITSALSNVVDQLKDVCTFEIKELENNEDVIEKICGTVLSSKILAPYKAQFSKMITKAIINSYKDNFETLSILKIQGGDLSQSFLADGYVLEKSTGLGGPKLPLESKVNDKGEKVYLKVLVANTPMNADKLKMYGAKAEVSMLSSLEEVENAENERLKRKVDIIKDSGADVFINRQLIYDYQMQLLHENNTMVVENADFKGVEGLSSYLNSQLITAFTTGSKITEEEMGQADKIEEMLVGDKKLLLFKKDPIKSCSIIIRAANEELLDEAARAIDDAVIVIKNLFLLNKAKNLSSLLISEGGCVEITAGALLEREAYDSKDGKQAMINKAMARAFYAVVEALVKNSGLDAVKLVSDSIIKVQEKLKAKEKVFLGLDLDKGSIEDDNRENGLIGSYHVKEGVLKRALEAVQAILRVDTVLTCTPRPRQEDDHHH